MDVPPVGGTTLPRARALGGPSAVVAACAAVLVLLGLGVRTGFAPQRELDTAVSGVLYAGDDRSRALDVLLEVLTAPGLSVFRYVVAAPVLVWLVRRRAWRTAAWVVVAAVFIRHVTSALKGFFGRVRPPFEEGGAGYDSLSFPSGHSSGIAALAAIGLVLAWPQLAPGARRGWAFAGALVVLLVGLTRLWLGVHYLSDVVAGWALGVGWVALTAVVFGVLPSRREERA